MARSRKHIKGRKYFLGGLLQAAASITPIGMMAKKLRAKKEEAEKGEGITKQAGKPDGAHTHHHGGKGEMKTEGKVLPDKVNDQKEGKTATTGGLVGGLMKKGGTVKVKKKAKPFKKSGVRANKKDDDKKINAVIVNEDDAKPDKTIYGPRNGGSCPEPLDINCPEDRKKMAEDILGGIKAHDNIDRDKNTKKKPINPKSYEDGGKIDKPEVKVPFKSDGPEKAGPQLPEKPEKLDDSNVTIKPSKGDVNIHDNKDAPKPPGQVGDKTVMYLDKQGDKKQKKLLKGFDKDKDLKTNAADMTKGQAKAKVKKEAVKRGLTAAERSKYISPRMAKNLRMGARFGRMGPMGAMAGVSYGMLDNYDEAHEQAFGPGLRDIEKTHGKKTRDRVENTTDFFGGVGGQSEGHIGGAGMGYKSKMKKGGRVKLKKKTRKHVYNDGGMADKLRYNKSGGERGEKVADAMQRTIAPEAAASHGNYKYGGKVGKVKGEVTKEKERKYIKNENRNYPKSLEYDILSGSGVLYSKRDTNKMKRVLKAKEESLYRRTGKKPPKRHTF